MGNVKLTDESYMPFGKYAANKPDACKLKDVPASYFHWLWQKSYVRQGDVFDYIRENMAALKKEDPDKEWDEDQ